MPCKDELIRAVWDWVLSAEPDNRVQYYSANEMVPECPVEEEEEEPDAVPQEAQQVQPASNGPSSTTKGKKPTSKAAAPKQKKQTVASLGQTI